jgi:hypothetical protein
MTIDREGFVHVLVRELVSEVWYGDVRDNLIQRVEQVAVLRYAPDGTRAWRYLRPPLEASFHDATELSVIGGDEIVFVEAPSFDLMLPALLVALDRHGNLLEEAPLSYRGAAFAIASDGTVYSGSPLSGTLPRRLGVVRLDAEGEVAWDAVLEADRARLVALEATHDRLVVLWADGDDEADRSQYLSAFENDLLVFTEQIDAADAWVAVRGLAIHCDGDLFLTGSAADVGAALEGPRDLWIARYSPEGALRWSARIAAPPPLRDGTGTQVVALSDGDLAIAGRYAVQMPGGAPTRAWLGRVGAAER